MEYNLSPLPCSLQDRVLHDILSPFSSNFLLYHTPSRIHVTSSLAMPSPLPPKVYACHSLLGSSLRAYISDVFFVEFRLKCHFLKEQAFKLIFSLIPTTVLFEFFSITLTSYLKNLLVFLDCLFPYYLICSHYHLSLVRTGNF
jgi:hypothetical protein